MKMALTPGKLQRTPMSVRRFISRMMASDEEWCRILNALAVKRQIGEA